MNVLLFMGFKLCRKVGLAFTWLCLIVVVFFFWLLGSLTTLAFCVFLHLFCDGNRNLGNRQRRVVPRLIPQHFRIFMTRTP